MDGSIRLHWLDGCILLLYLALLAGIGIYHTRRQQSLKEYFLAGRSMRWLPVGLSLMAALNSGMDYIMQPAGMIKFGAALLVVNLSWFLLYPYVFFVTLPLHRRMRGYSAYEYLERRFSLAVRLLAAAIFMLWRMGWMAAALYTPCLAISVASGRPEYVTHMIIVLGTVVTFYTMAGGIKAVIWTDVAQFCIMFTGLAVTLGVIFFRVDGGPGVILGNFLTVGTEKYAAPAGLADAAPLARIAEYFFIPLPAAGLLMACLVTRVATYTSDQVMVQRFQTSKSIRDARQGFIITAVSDAIWMCTLAFVGLSLFTYFEAHGWPPDAVRSQPDQLFPYFMGQVFPAGLTGLVIAAILAASLSSIDSAINSMSTVAMTDFYGRLRLRRNLDAAQEPVGEEQRRQVRVSRAITVLIGLVGVVLACNVSRLGTILEIANKVVNGFTGPILGIFLLGMFTKRANARGVFIGGLFGALASLYAICWSSPQLMNESLPFLLGLFPRAVAEGGRVLSFIWPSSFGLVTTLTLGYLASLLAPGITESARNWNWFAVTRRALEE